MECDFYPSRLTHSSDLELSLFNKHCLGPHKKSGEVEGNKMRGNIHIIIKRMNIKRKVAGAGLEIFSSNITVCQRREKGKASKRHIDLHKCTAHL